LAGYVQDVGLYVCGARNEMNINGDSVDGVVYLNMDIGKHRILVFGQDCETCRTLARFGPCFLAMTNLCRSELKGTMSRDFSSPVFSSLLLVPIGTSRKDLYFFQIFVELFAFVIDSLGTTTPGS
jgi:hypothetical protein